MEKLIANWPDYLLTYGWPLLKGIIVLFVGFRIIGWAIRKTEAGLVTSGVDETLSRFALGLLGLLLRIALVISVAATVGIGTTSFVAILGALAFAVGMSLQGSLGNFAGSVLIIFFKPFRIGDYIKAQGVEGIVKNIQMFTTEIESLDMQTIYIPNGPLAGGNITNVSKKGLVRLSIPVGIGYDDDIQKARGVLLSHMGDDERILKEPAPDVIVTELGDSSVNIAIRPWVRPRDGPAVQAEILEIAKLALDDAGIEIPFPQTVLHQKN